MEDIYLPYKKKRKTKAKTARKNGLEPLAKIIVGQRATDIESIALKYTNKELESKQGAPHLSYKRDNIKELLTNSIFSSQKKAV